MDIITKHPQERRQRNAGSEQQLPQLLDSPLPTPRRSCVSTDALRPRRRPDASPLRTQVPFSWESSPGVPKSRVNVHKAQEMPPPRPPPGRWPPCPSSRNWCYGNGSDASSDDCDTSSFSDALDRIVPSPERMIGSFDRATSKRFEDIFVGRATSFVKDRSSHARAGADRAVAASSSDRHSKHWRRRSTRRGDDDGQRLSKTRQSNDPVQVKVLPRINIGRPRVEQMSPRACGLMVLFPWSPKPAVCGFRSPSQYATPRSAAGDPSPSHIRRSTTLRDALQEEHETDSVQDLPQQPRGEKRSREEWQGRAWGVLSLLDTGKKYCTDARKALSKLSIGLGTESGSQRVGRERRSDKQQDVSTMPAMAAKLTKLKTNRN